MKIKLNSLYICNYDPDDIRKFNFLKDIFEDELIKSYLGKHVCGEIADSKNDVRIILDHSYIISNQRNHIGFISLPDLREGILTLEYGVHPAFRHKGYGTKILKEVSDYFLEERNFVEKVELCIDSENIYSQKAALSAGFKQLNDYTGMRDYEKIRKY